MRYSARVIRGRGEGRRLGFPTLNFEIPQGFDAPPGIYAGWVYMAGEKIPAAFHWGEVPAFGITDLSLEAHLIDRLISEKPESAEFELVKFLREIRDFSDPEALVSQIAEDVKQARQGLGL